MTLGQQHVQHVGNTPTHTTITQIIITHISIFLYYYHHHIHRIINYSTGPFIAFFFWRIMWGIFKYSTCYSMWNNSSTVNTTKVPRAMSGRAQWKS